MHTDLLEGYDVHHLHFNGEETETLISHFSLGDIGGPAIEP